MNTVTRTALANIRQNKSRNTLSGIAIILTTLLIFLVLTIGWDSLSIRFAGVNAYYPTYHCMFRQVPQKNADALKSHADIETLGLRADFGEIVNKDSSILMIAMDSEALTLNKIELEKGNFPEKENEIVIYPSMLDKLGLQANIGDEITLPYQLYEDGGLGWQKEDTFRISGFLSGSDTASENNSYLVLTSMEYMKNYIPEDQREYRVMFRLADTKGKTADAIEEQAKAIGSTFNVNEENIVINSDYLLANYVDPSFVTGIIGISTAFTIFL